MNKKEHTTKNEDRFGIKAKKSLGQNFLNSDGALDTIIKAGRVTKNDTILEIGPGKGALTKRLLDTGANVIAIEKDYRLIPFLQQLFAKEIKTKKLTLIHADVLNFDVAKVMSLSVIPAPVSTSINSGGIQSEKSESTWIPASAGMTNTGEMKYKLIANIPYYITGEITRKFLSGNFQPSLMVILVQKEVAERITTTIQGSSKTKEGKESILSISVKVYGEPKYIQTVKAGCFFPPPKVDSAILLIDNISKKNFSDFELSSLRMRGSTLPSISNKENSKLVDPRIRKDDNTEDDAKKIEQKFFEVVKTGFAHKRKTLSSNLKQIISKEKLSGLGIKENERAENLTVEEWLEITAKI
jgi:16S rRNA A1518/A1519 N6-dimethyltransferase RsmA/KsgA/DIM1 with predicted DNA glycosylase/AP lyase activity